MRICWLCRFSGLSNYLLTHDVGGKIVCVLPAAVNACRFTSSRQATYTAMKDLPLPWKQGAKHSKWPMRKPAAHCHTLPHKHHLFTGRYYYFARAEPESLPRLIDLNIEQSTWRGEIFDYEKCPFLTCDMRRNFIAALKQGGKKGPTPNSGAVAADSGETIRRCSQEPNHDILHRITANAVPSPRRSTLPLPSPHLSKDWNLYVQNLI